MAQGHPGARKDEEHGDDVELEVKATWVPPSSQSYVNFKSQMEGTLGD